MSAPWLQTAASSQNTDVSGKEDPGLLRGAEMKTNVGATRGLTLEQKGDLRGALGEFRAAYMLDPKDPFIKQNYERLLQQVNK